MHPWWMQCVKECWAPKQVQGSVSSATKNDVSSWQKQKIGCFFEWIWQVNVCMSSLQKKSWWILRLFSMLWNSECKKQLGMFTSGFMQCVSEEKGQESSNQCLFGQVSQCASLNDWSLPHTLKSWCLFFTEALLMWEKHSGKCFVFSDSDTLFEWCRQEKSVFEMVCMTCVFFEMTCNARVFGEDAPHVVTVEHFLCRRGILLPTRSLCIDERMKNDFQEFVSNDLEDIMEMWEVAFHKEDGCFAGEPISQGQPFHNGGLEMQHAPAVYERCWIGGMSV